MDPLRLLVTRPAAQAAEWVRELRARGLDAAALPLIGIAPLHDPAPLHAAWLALGARALVVFVSPNAVQHFFAARPAAQAGWPAHCLAGSTGPGTSAALRSAGVPADRLFEPAAEAAQFDSEALWQRLQAHGPWSQRAVLVVRGEEGRDWLADRLHAAGASVHFVAAYRRRAPVFGALEQALLAGALAAPARHVWLFSSSEAVAHLLRCTPPTAPWCDAVALASHPRIVEAARKAGFGRVAAVAPSPQAVFEALAGGFPPDAAS